MRKKKKKKECYWGDKCTYKCSLCKYFQPLDDSDREQEYRLSLKERHEEYMELLNEINDEVKYI